MPLAEVAAIQIFNGHFELMRLDAPLLAGMHPDRISAIDQTQLERAVGYLLPDVPLEDGLKRVLGGAVVVRLDNWLTAKQLVASGGVIGAIVRASFIWIGLPLLGSTFAAERLLWSLST
jgi:hypothetical protein